MAQEATTDGKLAPAEARSVTSAAQETTYTPDDKGGRTAEDRIAGYSAENKRLKEALEKERQAREALAEQHKSEDEKRLDQLVEERLKPHRAENQTMREFFYTQLEKMNAALPEEYRRTINPDAPFSILQEQYTSVQLLSRGLSDGKVRPKVDSAAVPPASEPKGMFTWKQFEDWQNMMNYDMEQFRKLQPEMEAAYREGRIREG